MWKSLSLLSSPRQPSSCPPNISQKSCTHYASLNSKVICFVATKYPKLYLERINIYNTYQEHRAKSFGGLCHIDGPIVPHHFCHVGQSPTVIKMEVADNNTVQVISQWAISDIRKIWEASIIIVSENLWKWGFPKFKTDDKWSDPVKCWNWLNINHLYKVPAEVTNIGANFEISVSGVPIPLVHSYAIFHSSFWNCSGHSLCSYQCC